MVYFIVKKQISLKAWLNNIKSGKKFWKYTLVTFVFLALSFGITTTLENIFSNLNTGMILLKGDGWFAVIIFAISTIIFPAITEETFYRKNIISFKNKGITILTTILGMFLFALEHALAVWGIVLAMIWAVPLSISYIKTKNVYVPMTAHFIANLLINGISVVAMVCVQLL